jgi:hypothetical protein
MLLSWSSSMGHHGLDLGAQALLIELERRLATADVIDGK